MANVVKIKRGNTVPTVADLPNDGELGYSRTTKSLYIRDGEENGAIVRIEEDEASILEKLKRIDIANPTGLQLGNLIKEIIGATYPVGSIYMTTSSENPATTFGFGTWEAWGQGRVPVGVDSSNTSYNTVEAVGGSETHTHTSVAHTHTGPSHTHTIASHTHTGPSHTHTINSHTHTGPSHTHTVGAHSHSNGTLHAQIIPWSTLSLAFNRVAVTAWTDNWYKLVSGGTGSDPGSSSYATNVAGSTSNSSVFNTGSSGTGSTGGTSLTTNSAGTGSTGGTSLTTAASGTGSTGSTTAQINSSSTVQPYITCYMWKRRA